MIATSHSVWALDHARRFPFTLRTDLSCRSHDIIRTLVLVSETGLLIVAPLLICNLPGTFVSLWKFAAVLQLDRQELGTIPSFMSLLVAMAATSGKHQLPLQPEPTA